MESYQPPQRDKPDSNCPYCRAAGALVNFPIFYHSGKWEALSPNHPDIETPEYLPLTQPLPSGQVTVFTASRCNVCKRVLLWEDNILRYPLHSVRPLQLDHLTSAHVEEITRIKEAQNMMDIAPAQAAFILRNVLLALCLGLGHVPERDGHYANFLGAKLTRNSERALLKKGSERNNQPLEPNAFDPSDDVLVVNALLGLIEYIAIYLFAGESPESTSQAQ